METRANYLMVGSFVLLLMVGLLVFVLWLARFQLNTEFERYDIFFQGSVTGLKEGSAVRYSGVKVGEVVFIGLDRDNPSQVRALVEVEDNTPVMVDTRASLAMEGLTGGRYILLQGGQLDSPPLVIEEGQKRPRIASERSAVDQVLEGAPQVMQNANALLAQANALLGPDNRKKVTSILNNLENLSAALGSQGPTIEAAVQDTAETMANLNNASDALEAMAVSLKDDSQRLVERASAAMVAIEELASGVESTVAAGEKDLSKLVRDLDGTAQAFTAMATEFQKLAKENRGPLKDFTENGLVEFQTFMIEARALIAGLNRVTTEVQRDPARFLFGDQQQGYETQQ